MILLSWIYWKLVRSTSEETAVDILKHHSQNPHCPIRFIGFSHGGNVIKDIINILATEGITNIDTLINFGTPIIPSQHSINEDTPIGLHINVFSPEDRTQTRLGSGSGLARGGYWDYSADHNVRIAYNPELFPIGDDHSFMHRNLDVWNQRIVPIINPITTPPQPVYIGGGVYMVP